MDERPRGPTILGSIRVRILVFVVVLLVVASIGSVLLLRAVLYSRLDAEVELDLAQEAEEFVLLSTGNDPTTGQPFDGDLRALFDTYFARELPDEGESLLAFVGGDLYASRRAQDGGDASELTSAIEYWLSLDRREQGSIETELGVARYVALPVAGAGEDGLFVVANFPAFERREINDAVRTHIIVALVTMVVIGALGLFIAGRILRPLTSLASTARTISDTDFQGRISISGRDEASQIAAQFNEMLDRLEVAFAGQRRFLHDTSHELRTPLTVVRGHVELLDIEPTPEDRRATIALVLDEVDRMIRMVNELFLLAMADLPDFVQRQPIDLRDVVLDVERKAMVLADREWAVEAPEAVRVEGDPDRLAQALLQLAANAVAHTDPGDRIELGVQRRSDEAVLWVDDAGRGVPPELVDRIFERFSGAAGGTGLGLSIVQAIASAHGGSARLVPRPTPGARFELVLPTKVWRRAQNAGVAASSSRERTD